MALTFAEKILAKKAGLKTTVPGQIVEITPDVALSHDNTAPIFGIFQRMGGDRVFNPDMQAVFLDHAAPAPTTKHAENHRITREFVLDQGIKNFFDVGKGICHQVLVEQGLALPGEIVLGSDSHTPHAGVMGAFGAGIGRELTAKTGEQWEVINASRGDTHTRDHIRFLGQGMAYRPDVVLLLYVFNDIDYLHPVTPRMFQSTFAPSAILFTR